MKVEIKGLELGQLNPHNYGGMCSRESVELLRKDEIDFEKGIDTVATTDAPAIVADWSRWEYIREVLPMRYMEGPDDDDATLLDTHDRSSVEKIMGSARNWTKDENNAYAKLFVSEVETEVRQKIKEKHIKRVSVGYQTDSSKTVEIPKGKEVTIDGITYKNEYKDNFPFIVRLWWKIKELSLVPIPADKAAKFRAELEGKIKSEDPDLQKKLDEAMDKIKKLEDKIIIKQNAKELTMAEEKKERTPKEERERIQGINDVAKMVVVEKLYKGGKDALEKAVSEAINSEISVMEFQEKCFNNLKNEDIVLKPTTDLDLSPKDVKKLSIGRAINAMIEVRGGNLNAWDKFNAGLEREAIAAVTERISKIPGYELKGLPLAMDFFKNEDVMKHSSVLKAARRNAVREGIYGFNERSVGATAAQYVIGTENMFNEFIDVLRNLGVAGQWGTRMITGANQNISVPKKTSTGTFHWVAESGTGTATDFVIGQLTATPHNGWASMKRTRQASYQSVPELDALIIDDILNNMITGRDLALLHGTGASNQPTGIDHTSGIGDVVGGSLDWEAIVEFWTDVKTNNINSNNLRFVMNALTAGKLMTRQVVSGQAQMLWDRLSQLSAPPIVSEQVAANNLFYGDGSESWMIDWGVIDLLVNPYKDDTGDVTITAFTAMDVLVSRANAFSLADDVS